mgnify:CR=1 FL=1|jgi:hypothetical protein
MKNQGRKSITLSLQVSVIGNIPSGNFKLGSPKEVFLIKNITIMGIGILIKILGIPLNKGTPNKDSNNEKSR